MTRRMRITLTCAMLTIAAGAAIGWTTVGDGDDEVVKLADVPQAARQVIEEHARGGEIREIERSKEKDGTVYEVKVKGADGTFEFVVAENGKYLGEDHEDEDGQGEMEDGDNEHGEAADDEQVTVIQFAEAPASVRAAYSKVAGNAAATRVERIEDEGAVKYELEFAGDGGPASVTIADHGEVMEIEHAASLDKLPEAVRREVMKDYPDAKINEIGAVQAFYYEIDLTVDGRRQEIKVLATGDIEDEGGEHADRGDEDHEHKAGHEDEDDDDHGAGRHEEDEDDDD